MLYMLYMCCLYPYESQETSIYLIVVRSDQPVIRSVWGRRCLDPARYIFTANSYGKKKGLLVSQQAEQKPYGVSILASLGGIPTISKYIYIRLHERPVRSVGIKKDSYLLYGLSLCCLYLLCFYSFFWGTQFYRSCVRCCWCYRLLDCWWAHHRLRNPPSHFLRF